MVIVRTLRRPSIQHFSADGHISSTSPALSISRDVWHVLSGKVASHGILWERLMASHPSGEEAASQRFIENSSHFPLSTHCGNTRSSR